MGKKTKDLKITDEQLQNLQGLVNQINQAQLSVGQLETQKAGMIAAIGDFQMKLKAIEVYGGHIISDIVEEDDKYRIFIKKEDEVLPWKDFNKNMAIAIEFNLEY